MTLGDWSITFFNWSTLSRINLILNSLNGLTNQSIVWITSCKNRLLCMNVITFRKCIPFANFFMLYIFNNFIWWPMHYIIAHNFFIGVCLTDFKDPYIYSSMILYILSCNISVMTSTTSIKGKKSKKKEALAYLFQTKSSALALKEQELMKFQNSWSKLRSWWMTIME